MLIRSDKVGEAEREFHEASLFIIWRRCYFFYILCVWLDWHDYAMQLKAESEQATKTFETIVKLMNEEIGRFQEQKTLDMGIAFHEFAKGQARLANGIADAWRSLLPKLEACSSS